MLRDRLQKYRDKRDFGRTAEPSGAASMAPRGSRRTLRYLIQKHAARAMHYDFRLEHDGVLLSWAIPKGPSIDPADKRLAVHVEDHPIGYGDFEGTIPKGQYGGGTVMLWDTGTWEPRGDVDDGIAKGNLKFELQGERLKGGWALIRLRSRSKRDGGRDNWLLIKEKDSAAKAGGRQPVDKVATSVTSGRTMEEIARGSDIWRSKKKSAKAPARKTTRAKADAKKNLEPARRKYRRS